MGRDKRNEQRHEHFTTMVRNTMEAPAWRALSPTSQSLYVWVRLEWRGPKANNNGKIRLSVRQAAERMGVKSLNTISRAFHDLQAKGFLVVREHAVLGTQGEAKSPAFELTELPLPNAESNQGQRLYRNWREGHDFPVIRAVAHNPTGRGPKLESCRKNEDGAVSKIATFPRRPSQK
ncbi:hypothetical protein P73_2461 [Celeribacter indicus]|uniref:Uncharacterized protein n=1 Tax=Celeribacter indicus TaxID=1208324 RepID=A0A0B5E2D8_9RHOB|nr:hypothetical protein P73_2461 [Celeribacter indicus]